jgi:unsaturated rhamnogalacturonyl hydrolase
MSITTIQDKNMTNQIVEKFKEQYRISQKYFVPRWHYVEACIMKAYLDSYAQSGNEDEFVFVKRFIDSMYDEQGAIPEINPDYYSIDQLRMGSVLLTLFRREKDPKYKRVIDLLYNQIKTYPRTVSGNFWHKENYPDQVWLDGLFMGQPFYVEYIRDYEAVKDYSDTLRQFENVRKNIFDEKRKLYLHAFDESRKMFWCDKTTGLSPNVWGRAVGWFVMALVDVLELLQNEPVNDELLIRLLKETIDGMLPYQHASGMWYQIVDMPNEPDNYLESSGTSMLAYAILKGVRLGYLGAEYLHYGKLAFEGTTAKYLHETDGELRLGGICKSAGLGKHPDTGVIRDGSFRYYVFGEEVVENNGHGVAPFLMAYNEIKLLK